MLGSTCGDACVPRPSSPKSAPSASSATLTTASSRSSLEILQPLLRPYLTSPSPRTAWHFFKLGEPLSSNSYIKVPILARTDTKSLSTSPSAQYIANSNIPVKRGTFIDFRSRMVITSPVGRNASAAERVAFEGHDSTGVRRKLYS
ncbi:hypothetical protein LZ31DRAFT_327446 [Colletotrichum somersetense]|nr:hypothetical protein LZ31DRAFT_327446 [Colletotrichum somersetense]